MMTDSHLLSLYIERQDHEAFRTLVDRHAGMVYGVALRRTTRPHLADEVAQTVFVQLAKKAGALKDRERLAGWLHRSACLESAHLLRKDRREAAGRVKLSRELNAETVEPRDREAWRNVVPVIDQALSELMPGDREIILSKYYENLSYREIAERLRKSEAASRKQVSRALEKLGRLLRRKGVVVTPAILTQGLRPELSSACPVGLVDAIEGRVAELSADTMAPLLGASLAAVYSSKFALMILAAVSALVPLSTDWVRRATVADAPNQNSFAERSVLDGRFARTPVSAERPPTLDEVLASHGTVKLELLVRWLPSAELEDLQALGAASRETLRRGVADEQANLFWALFLQRWFQLDPQSALAFAEEARSDDWRSVLGGVLSRSGPGVLSREGLFALWTQMDPEAALEAAEAESMALVLSVLGRIQEIDPWKAFALSRELDPAVAASLPWQTLFSRLAASDFQQALKMANTLDNPLARDGAFAGLIEIAAKTDPGEALALVEAAEIGFSARTELVETVFKTWLESEPEKAAQAIQTRKLDVSKLGLCRAAAIAWSRVDPDAAMAWVENLNDSREKRAALSGLAFEFSQSDIDRARTLLDQLGWDFTDADRVLIYTTGGYGGYGLAESLEKAAQNVLHGVADRDRMEAVDLLARIPNPASKDAILYDFARDWLQEDPAGMKAFIEQTDDLEMKASLARYYAPEFVKADPDGALAWLNDLPGQARDEALLSILTTHEHFQNDYAIRMEWLPEILTLPESSRRYGYEGVFDRRNLSPEQLAEALDWLEAQPNKSEVSEAYAPIASQWAQEDLAGAAEWINEIDEGAARQAAANRIQSFDDLEMRELATKNVLSAWLTTDPDAARAWAADLSDQAMRDQANTVFTYYWQSRDPNEAFAYANAIVDESMRFEGIRWVVRPLKKQNPALAAEFLEAAQLSPVDKALLAN